MAKFKDARIEKEYNELPVHNPRLAKLLRAAETFVELEFKKEIVYTSIFRTQAEHDALYAQTPPGLKPASSPHMFWEAADLRSTIFTDEEINRLLGFLNTFTFRNGKQVSICHAVAGGAMHFHIQYSKV